MDFTTEQIGFALRAAKGLMQRFQYLVPIDDLDYHKVVAREEAKASKKNDPFINALAEGSEDELKYAATALYCVDTIDKGGRYRTIDTASPAIDLFAAIDYVAGQSNTALVTCAEVINWDGEIAYSTGNKSSCLKAYKEAFNNSTPGQAVRLEIWAGEEDSNVFNIYNN